MTPARPADRGFALVIVLWTLVLVTLLVTSMTAAGRSEVRMAASLRNAAVAQAAVDGALNEAIFRVSGREWGYGPYTRTLRIGGVPVQVEVTDEAGLVGVNDAPLPMLVALLQEVGVPPANAASLGAAIWDFRSSGDDPSPHGAKTPQYAAAGLPYGAPGQPMQSLGELALVLGMTPDIVARLAPHISFLKTGGLDLAMADPVVAHAFAAAGPDGGYKPVFLRPGDVATVRITARSPPPAAGVVRSATIRVPGSDSPGPAYYLMGWQ